MVVVTAPPVVNDELVEDACLIMDELMARRRRFGICWDMSEMTMVGRSQRKILMGYQKANVDRVAEWVVAEAHVFRSPLVVGLAAAIQSVARSRHPIRTFETIAPACQWVRSMLASEG